MNTVVISYPLISKSAFKWIQTLRKEYDRQYEIVLPHFTLIFPTEKLSGDEMIEHVKSRLDDQPKIAFRLTKAIIVEDASKTFFHTFLVPGEGAQEIITLHDRLYAGTMATELRLDTPFIPHIGIGSNASEEVMKELRDKVNSAGLPIEGYIDALTTATFDGKTVNDVKTIGLH
jgi:2'-5' RNA ligase